MFLLTFKKTLEHKTSLKSLGYICKQIFYLFTILYNMQYMQYISTAKIIRILSKDLVPWIYIVKFLL